MKQPIPQWPISSPESVHYRPRPSRLQRSWWWFLHVLVIASIAAASLDLVWKCLAAAGALGHAWWRFPPPVPEFAMLCKERWSVPDSQRHELRLAPGSHFAGWWIKLVLVDSDGTLEWILYHDQLPPARWKALAREVRSTS